jgi:UDP-N-acetylglucosamine:LPS N-acetylglucosamine transferase
LSTIAELSALGKTAIVIPMPGTHQEDNGKILSYTNSAAVLIGKEKAGGKSLLKLINYLKFNQKAAMSLSENIRRLLPKDAAEKLAKIIIHQIDS